MGKTKDAKGLLERLVFDYPKSPAALSNLGYLCLVVDSDTARARKLYDQAISMDPDYEQAIVNKAGLWAMQRKNNDATVLLSKYLKRKPQFTLHPNITYFKQVNNTEKIAIMEKSKGLIFPVKWHEPFGLAIVESFYAGCHVFGSTFGSLQEFVLPEDGILRENIYEINSKINTF